MKDVRSQGETAVGLWWEDREKARSLVLVVVLSPRIYLRVDGSIFGCQVPPISFMLACLTQQGRAARRFRYSRYLSPSPPPLSFSLGDDFRH